MKRIDLLVDHPVELEPVQILEILDDDSAYRSFRGWMRARCSLDLNKMADAGESLCVSRAQLYSWYDWWNSKNQK